MATFETETEEFIHNYREELSELWFDLKYHEDAANDIRDKIVAIEDKLKDLEEKKDRTMDKVCTFMYKGKPLVKPGETAYVDRSTNPPTVVQSIVRMVEITDGAVLYRFASIPPHYLDDVFADADSAWQAAYGRYYAQLEELVKSARATLEERERLLKEAMDDIKKEVWKNG
jgi:hypothetical protein